MVFKITSIILTFTVVTSCTGRLYFRPLPIRKDESESPTPLASNFVKTDQFESIGLQKQNVPDNGIDYTVIGGGGGLLNQNDPDPNNYFGTHGLGSNKPNLAAQVWSLNEDGNGHNQDGQGGPVNGDSDHILDGSRLNGDLLMNIANSDNFRSNKYRSYEYNTDGFGSNSPEKSRLGFLSARHAHIHSNGLNKSGATLTVNHPEEQQEHHIPEPLDLNEGVPDENNQGNRMEGYGAGGNEQPWVGHDEGNSNVDRGDSHGTDINGMNGYRSSQQNVPNGPNFSKQVVFSPSMNLGNPDAGSFAPGPMRLGAPNGIPVNNGGGGFQASINPVGHVSGSYEFGQNSGNSKPIRIGAGNFGGHNLLLGGFDQTPERLNKKGFKQTDQVQSGHYFQ